MSVYSVDDVLAAIAHLREGADFNRSFTDGRRAPPSRAYTARRIELAEERERWAQAIEMLLSEARGLAASAVLLELGRSDDRV
jgi:hypothetical protein